MGPGSAHSGLLSAEGCEGSSPHGALRHLVICTRPTWELPIPRESSARSGGKTPIKMLGAFSFLILGAERHWNLSTRRSAGRPRGQSTDPLWGPSPNKQTARQDKGRGAHVPAPAPGRGQLDSSPGSGMHSATFNSLLPSPYSCDSQAGSSEMHP